MKMKSLGVRRNKKVTVGDKNKFEKKKTIISHELIASRTLTTLSS
jgi:hypothetical protein